MRTVTVILRCVVAIAFVAAAGLKLANSAEFSERLAGWGYPTACYYLILAVELLGGFGLLWPKTAEAAAGVLILLMIGALYTHFSHGDSLVAAAPAILLLLSLSSIVVLRRRERSAISL